MTKTPHDLFAKVAEVASEAVARMPVDTQARIAEAIDNGGGDLKIEVSLFPPVATVSFRDGGAWTVLATLADGTAPGLVN